MNMYVGLIYLLFNLLSFIYLFFNFIVGAFLPSLVCISINVHTGLHGYFIHMFGAVLLCLQMSQPALV